jgi:hypothetical protein
VYCVGTTVIVQKEESKQDVGLLNPQERVSAVRPMWEQRSHADRVELLTVALSSLKQEAEQQAEKARATAGAHAYEEHYPSWSSKLGNSSIEGSSSCTFALPTIYMHTAGNSHDAQVL